MEDQDVEFVGSSSNQHMIDSSGTQDYCGWNSYGLVSFVTEHGSIAGSIENYDYHLPPMLLLNVTTNALDPWGLEEPSYGGPLSPCSSIGHTESVCTPSYIDTPMDLALNSLIFQHLQSLPNSGAWSDEREFCWKLDQMELPTRGPQQLSLPYLDRTAFDQVFPQCIRDYVFELSPLSAPGCASFHEFIPYPAAGVVDSAPLEENLTVSPHISEEDSDPESDNCGWDNDALTHRFSHSTTWRFEEEFRVMPRGRWGPIAYPFYTILEPRQYRCPLMHKRDPPSLCAKQFRRQEHLRRHVVTVHGSEKCYRCKVCPRPFSRRDNLREHYWTHLKREGRMGKNKKMSLTELKAILGPQEKKLVKRLENKLHEHQARRPKTKP